MKSVLVRFIHGDLSSADILLWAEFLELREDIDYAESEKDFMQGLMHELAKPHLEGSLSIERAELIISNL